MSQDLRIAAVSRIWGPCECAGRNVSERRASLEKDDVQADQIEALGKAGTRVGEMSEEYARPPHRGSGGSMYTRKAHATREAPEAWLPMTNRTPARDRPGALGWRRGSQYC